MSSFTDVPVRDLNALVHGCNYVKLAFTALLQAAYAHESTPPEYKYDSDENKSQITIYRRFPKRSEKFPNISVVAESGDASVSYFGREELFEVRNETTGQLEKVVISGRILIPVTIEINALSTTDREKLTDRTFIYVRYLFRNKVSELGIAFTTIKIGGEREETLPNGEILYTNSINLPNLYMEFTDELDKDLFVTISQFNVTDAIK